MTFPYRFLAAAVTGEIATSQDGAAWAANGILPGTGGSVSAWDAGALSGSTGRAIFVGHGTANKIEVAYTDDGDNYTHVIAPAPGMNAFPAELVWTDLFNAGRFYCCVRQNGANDGGVWYSDDDGATWTAMPFAGSPAGLDVVGLAVGTDRVLVAAYVSGDATGVVRLFYSTDGTTMAAGASCVTNFGTINTGDGAARSLVYLPDANLFSFVGASISVFFPAAAFTTVDGTAITAGPTAVPLSNDAAPGVGVWMPNVSRLIVPSFLVGAVPHQAFMYGTNGLTFTPVAEGSPPTSLCYGFVYNGGRAIGGQNTGTGGGGFIYTDDGISYTNVAGPSVKKWRALIARGPSPLVPNVIGMLLADATAALVAAGFVLGVVTTVPDNAFPDTQVLSQFPLGGSAEIAGTSVAVTVAVPNTEIVPDVIGMTLAEAENTIRAAGFGVGTVTVTTEPLGALGTVVVQSPPGGSSARPGALVSLTSTALLEPFNVDATVISQYTTSPTIVRLVEDMAEYVDQRVNITNFFNLIWNVDTAVGFGLDIWGRIVGVSRLLRLPSTDPIFGYNNADDPPDWQTFNNGIFFPGTQSTQSYELPDDAFRTLILTKALSNIVATNAASLNALLRNLFPGRGKAYVVDLGGMAMRFVFEFSLSSTELAILTQSGALPHPAGVSYSVVVIPTATFGFVEAGPISLPFDFGVFYLPPA